MTKIRSLSIQSDHKVWEPPKICRASSRSMKEVTKVLGTESGTQKGSRHNSIKFIGKTNKSYWIYWFNKYCEIFHIRKMSTSTQKRVIFLAAQVPGFAILHTWKEIIGVQSFSHINKVLQFLGVRTWLASILRSWDLCEAFFTPNCRPSSCEKREAVPHNPFKICWAAFVRNSIAEVDDGKDGENKVEALFGTHPVNWGLNSNS